METKTINRAHCVSAINTENSRTLIERTQSLEIKVDFSFGCFCIHWLSHCLHINDDILRLFILLSIVTFQFLWSEVNNSIQSFCLPQSGNSDYWPPLHFYLPKNQTRNTNQFPPSETFILCDLLCRLYNIFSCIFFTIFLFGTLHAHISKLLHCSHLLNCSLKL